MKDADRLAWQLANDLLRTGAITLSPAAPYTWSSGWRSPIYCDNRLTLSYPIVRDRIVEALVHGIREQVPETEAIAGTATAGIAHAAIAADRLNLPMLYVRGEKKAHGKGKQVEGRLLAGARVVVFEDTVSTGGSVLAACSALRAEGATVTDAWCIFTYGFAVMKAAFARAQVQLHVLTDLSTLTDVAVAHGALATSERAALAAFVENPEGYQSAP
jgi:orotate phosphoribosyltransferase